MLNNNYFIWALSFLFILLILLIVVQCGTNQNLNNKEQTSSKSVIEYTRYKGRIVNAPKYSIKIFESGHALYVGEENVEVVGERTIKIPTRQYKSIINSFSESNFDKFDKEYFGRLQDLPVSRISFNNHSIRYDDRTCPVELNKLAEMVLELVPKNEK